MANVVRIEWFFRSGLISSGVSGPGNAAVMLI